MSATLGVASRIWKYPRTPYWPYSPAQTRDGDALADPKRFVGQPVVVTEKLDGSNTLLHQGDVYARSVSAPATAKWLAMVKKYHAWKVTEPDVFLYGEDIYGVHSIEYDPVPETRTFYAFALRFGDGSFGSFREMADYGAVRAPSRWCRFCWRGRSTPCSRLATSSARRTPSRQRWAGRGRA